MDSSSRPRRIASHRLLDKRGITLNPLVEVAPDGEILSVGRCDAPDSMAGTEFHPGVLVPGLVNAHCHLELSYLKGRIPSGGGFSSFARALRGERNAADAAGRLRASAAADARMWSEGTAAAGDVSNTDESFAVKRNSRIAYRNFAEVYGLNTSSPARQRALLAYPHTTLTPHSLYTLQEAVLREICNEGDSPLSIHFMETPDEAELFRGRGGLYEWYVQQGLHCDFLHHRSPSSRLISCIPRHRSVLLIHACCVEQQDIDRIMEHFMAPVWWCLCPRSNRRISGLTPPVDLLRANRLNICVGTDSLASNDDLCLLEELKQFADVPLDELLRWATVNGAAALGFDGLGVIAPGTKPGIAVISPLDYPAMKLTRESRIRRIV